MLKMKRGEGRYIPLRFPGIDRALGLKEGANINGENSQDWMTALHLAAREGRERIVQSLLEERSRS